MAELLREKIEENGYRDGDLVRYLGNVRDLVNDLQTMAANIQTAMANGLLAIGTLAIHATPEQFKTTTTAYYRIGSIQYSKAATTALTFSTGHVVSASKFGVILVQINAAGTVSTKVPLATQAYNSAPLALAALPAADTGNVALGYIAIAAKAATWTANTDDLTDGSDLTTATFVDGTPLAAFLTTVSALTNTTPLTLNKG